MATISIGLVTDTLRALNKDLPGLDIALHKGKGYFYFEADVVQCGDDPETRLDVNETHSVYVNAFNHLAFEEWVVIGHDFIRKVKGIVADQIERNHIPS